MEKKYWKKSFKTKSSNFASYELTVTCWTRILVAKSGNKNLRVNYNSGVLALEFHTRFQFNAKFRKQDMVVKRYFLNFIGECYDSLYFYWLNLHDVFNNVNLVEVD